MKTKLLLSAILCVTFASTSCDSLLLSPENGEIRIAFLKENYIQTKASSSEIPDTNNFILNIADSKGNSIYNGLYGAAPETIITSPGKYEISVKSSEFKKPAFSSPQYGDTQEITVESGKVSRVSLICRQINSGVKLNISSKFLSTYPDASLLLKSDGNKLLYSYTEKRIAYFNPGSVSLILSQGAQDRLLLTRDLAPRDILTLNISIASTANTNGTTDGRICIQVDTARNWISEKYTIGDNSTGSVSDIDHALSVNDAKNSIGSENVWIYGYIVGGDLTSSRASFEAPFTSRTNIVLASKSSVTEKSSCISVQLQKGDIRDALNLVDNPDNLKKTVYIKGNIVSSYYGIPGIQNITEYQLK